MKCKLVVPIAPNSSFEMNQIYIYKIIEQREFYPYNYFVYDNNKSILGRNIGQFSEEYFKYHFIDIQKERKQKLNEIHSNKR